MPELPEVETVRRGLESVLPGKTIEELVFRRSNLRIPLPPEMPERLRGRKIGAIGRRGKYLLMHHEGGAVAIAHLGMSGRMVYTPHEPPPPARHDHVIWRFAKGGALVFHDPRRFGLLTLSTAEDWPQHALLARMGPEPLGPDFSAAFLYEALQPRRGPVKQALLDQSLVAGLGNIYVCEALFRAGIHPVRRACDLTQQETEALAAAIVAVLEEAIASGGSTLRDYVRSSGEAGYFQHHFDVYDRAGKPCTRCGALLVRLVMSGRSTFFCPHCQPEV